jgi:Fur family ferric uptake transcriptional regulator
MPLVKRDSSVTAAAALLRGAGLRRTPVRVGVLDVLAAAAAPLAAPDVLDRLPGHTDAVTVYRTLNTFTRERLAHRVRGADRTWRYALTANDGRPASRETSAAGAAATAGHAHAHFVCDACGRVECLEAARIPRGLVESLRLGPRYSVRYPEVLLHGVCPKCK